jgi:hypothetical protein
MQPMTDDELRDGFSRIFDKMLMAGWIKNYTFTIGKGFSFSWERDGADKVILLRSIIQTIRFETYADVVAFTDAAMKGTFGGDFPTQFEKGTGEFWLDCMRELGLGKSKKDMLLFLQAVEGWAPSH